MRGIILFVIIVAVATGVATAAQKLITSDFDPALAGGAVGGATLLMSRRRGSGKNG
jgi:hypothetical protein